MNMDSLEVVRRQTILRNGKRGDIWTIVCSGIKVTQQAPPFAADSRTIYCTRSAYNEGLLPSIIARRAGDTVIWISDLDYLGSDDAFVNVYPLPAIDLRRIFIFDAVQYQIEVGVGRVEHLPEITTTELSSFLRCLRFPDPVTALYLADDYGTDVSPSGAVTFVRRWVEANRRDFVISEVPKVVKTLRIGLDIAGFPEAVWNVGLTDKGIGICFHDYPCFRTWMSLQLRGGEIPNWLVK